MSKLSAWVLGLQKNIVTSQVVTGTIDRKKDNRDNFFSLLTFQEENQREILGRKTKTNSFSSNETLNQLQFLPNVIGEKPQVLCRSLMRI